MSGVELIAAERTRQVESEGWTTEHDDEHGRGELAKAAEVYVLCAWARVNAYDRDWISSLAIQKWPWSADYLKESEDPIRNLVKAGALIAAEIDRLQRLESL